MKKNITSLAMALLFTYLSQAQEPDSLKSNQAKHISKELAIPQEKAEKVTQIMDAYKSQAKAVLANTALSKQQISRQMAALIAEKNQKLGQILTEAQMDKIVPTTERNQIRK
ncbi:hypothetical protein PBAC_00200 [Pedobacter glucosidilyticus]|nr:hypothetical protein [Pedobacter glucosidilyticus]KHJ39513.1 hypothetical protein PBAC_00200 [Pedobacter glucosidilyticus]